MEISVGRLIKNVLENVSFLIGLLDLSWLVQGCRKKNLFLSLPFLFSMIKSTLPFLPVNIIKWSWRWGVLRDFPLILIQSIHLDFSSIAFLLLVPLALLKISWRSALPYLAKKRDKLTLFLSTSLDSEWKPCLKLVMVFDLVWLILVYYPSIA